jgi:hypothetical protein
MTGLLRLSVPRNDQLDDSLRFGFTGGLSKRTGGHKARPYEDYLRLGVEVV